MAADCAENTVDTTTYGGPDSSFTDINAQESGGIVNFIDSLATGDSTFFSLEEALSATTVVSGGPTASEQGGAPNGSEHFTVCQSAKPVNCATGEFWHSFTDFKIPGRGVPLDFTRTYVSGNASTDGPLGFGWTDSYDSSLSIGAAGNVTVNQDDGSTVEFSPSGSGTFVAPPRVLASLIQNSDGSYTFTQFANGIAYNFSSSGVLQSEVDRNGYMTMLNYTGSQLMNVSDAAGRDLALSYSGSHISKITDPLGRTETFQYDVNGNLIKTTDALGRSWSFTYDPNHLLLAMTDPNGGITTNTYNGSNQVVSQTNAVGQRTTWAYSGDPSSPVGGTTTITDPHGSVTIEDYANLELTSVTTAAGTPAAATTSYTYDPATLGVTSVTDPDGHVTTNSYDANGNKLGTTDPLGNMTTYTYNGFNEVTSTTTPLGETTNYSYDANGNLLGITDPLGGVYNLTYGDSSHPGDLTIVNDPDGHVTTLTYDSQGDEASVTVSPTSSAHNTTEYAYDLDSERTCIDPANSVAAGKTCPTTVTSPVVGLITQSYDSDGELLSASNADGGTTSYSYDNDGNVTSETDPGGNATKTTYDLLDRPLKVTTGANGTAPSTTTDSYDIAPGSGTCASSTTGATYCDLSENASSGATTSYYNAADEVINETRPGGDSVAMIYDAAGNNTSRTDAAGRTTLYAYDADNRVTTIGYSDGTTPNVTYSYDADGHRTAMTDGSGTTTYSYDADGHLSASTNGAGATVSYTYDRAGNILTIAYPDGRNVTHSYDGAGRLASISDGSGNTSNFSYDPDGNLTSTAYPNGDTVASTYDAADQLSGTSVVPSSNSSSRVASIAYTRNATGQTTQETDGGALSGTTSFAYNASNQLSSVNGSNYTYDSTGDLTGLPSGVTQAFNAAQELTAQTTLTGTTSYTYDSVGDRTSSSGSGDPTEFTYNQAGELTTLAATAPPAFTNAAKDTVSAGSSFTFNVTTTGTPSPAISLASGSALPSGVTLTDNGSGAATLAGTSSVAAGVYTFTTQAANGVSPNATQAFTLTVTAPPAFTNAAKDTVSAGSSFTFNVTTTGTPSPAISLASGSALPSGVTLTDNGSRAATLAGTSSVAAGVYTFTTQAANGVSPNATQAFTLTVTAPPAFTNAAKDTVSAGSSFTFNVTTTGTPSPAISLASGSALPSGVTLTDNGSGAATLAGTSSVAAGVYTFTTQAVNGVSPNATQAFTLTVAGSMALKPTRLSTTLSAPGSFGGRWMHWWSGRPLLLFFGASVRDRATLGGVKASVAGGTVTYTVYRWVTVYRGIGPRRSHTLEWKAVASGGTVKVTNGSVPRSNRVSLPAGYYQWQAKYSGDALNASSVSPFGSEAEIVVPAPRCPGPPTLRPNDKCRVSSAQGPPSTHSKANASTSNVPATRGSTVIATLDPVTYTYNGDGLRMTETSGSTTEKFAWDTNESTSELLADGSADYIYGPTGVPIEQVSSSNVVDYYFHDAIGSTRALLTSSGAIAATFTYTAYGSTSSSTGTGTTPFQFAGGYRDSDSGLYYLINRYYDPSTGQFLTVDPAIAVTQEPYSYAADQPTVYNDSDGLQVGGVCVTGSIEAHLVIGVTGDAAVCTWTGSFTAVTISVSAGPGIGLGGGVGASYGASYSPANYPSELAGWGCSIDGSAQFGGGVQGSYDLCGGGGEFGGVIGTPDASADVSASYTYVISSSTHYKSNIPSWIRAIYNSLYSQLQSEPTCGDVISGPDGPNSLLNNYA